MRRKIILALGVLVALGVAFAAYAGRIGTSGECSWGVSCDIGNAEVDSLRWLTDTDVQVIGGKTGSVTIDFRDYGDTDDDDMAHAIITTNCTVTTTGAEDCDFSIGVVEDGAAAQTRFIIDADSGIDLGSSLTSDITFVTDGAAMAIDATLNEFLFTAGTTGTVTLKGADAAGASNLTLDVTDAGLIIIGSADVTDVTIDTVGLDVAVDGTTNELTLTAAGTGTVVIMGADAAGDSDLLIDTSGLGAITIGSADVTSVSIITDGGTLTLDGSVTADVAIVTITTATTLTPNTVHLATTDTAVHPVPACVAANLGEWVTVVVGDVSETIHLSLADASNRFVVSGVDTSAAAHELDSPTAAATSGGASITLTCLVAEFWHSTAMTGVWIDGN